MAMNEGWFTGNGDEPRCLVAVFLRGAADGLNMVIPCEDDAYYSARPKLGVAKKDAEPLDGFFRLHPELRALAGPYRDGALALIHMAGSEDDTRSHFEAQDLMEHGGTAAGGWLGRFLRYRERPASGALSAVALGKAMPECLRGAPSVSVMQSIEDFSLGSESPEFTAALGKFYAAPDALGAAGRDTLAALGRIRDLRSKPYRPAAGVKYPEDSFGRGLEQTARLIKAKVGLEAVSLDLEGWDSHFTQKTLMEPLMRRLAEGLTAFHKDLGPLMATTTVAVMTEFGRRVAENTSFGTDHGRGGVMMLLGGGVLGGRVLHRWSGLKENLEGPGDLPVEFNYRNILAPVLTRHGAGAELAKVFPGFDLAPAAIYG